MKTSIFKYLSVGILVFLSFSCTDKKGTTKTLLDAGYHPIKVGGYAFLGCGEGDIFHTKFVAMSPDSTRKVSGQVCRGIFKGSTIRLD